MSNETALLYALLNGEDIGNFEPKSRMEAYLKNCCLACGCEGLPEPLTETDALLYRLAEKIASGGGSGDDNTASKIIDGTITEISDTKATKIHNSVFRGCTSLKTADFYAAQSIMTTAFHGCSALTTLNCPEVTSIEQMAFYNCTALTKANFPKLTKIVNSVFFGCSAIAMLDFMLVESIDVYAFAKCASLKTLILRNKSNIVSLANVSAFQETPFADGGTGGTIYVPEELVKFYQVATNWTTLYDAGTCNFVAIEGSEYE